MDFVGMKRKELQALCKKHGIPANLANLEMAHRLALLLQEEKKPEVSDKKTEPEVVANNVKKVKFSPENETFIFIESDSDSDSDYVSERTTRLRNRKTAKRNGFEEKNVTGKVRVTRRSQAKSVSFLEEYSELGFWPVNRRKRGKEIADVSEPKRELTERQLRRRKMVNGAAGIGDMTFSGEKTTREDSKKTLDGKDSDGFLLKDRVFEAEGAPKPEKINKNSKRNSRKDNGSGVALTEDIEKVGIGVETRRVRALASRSGSSVDSKCDEPLKGVEKKETEMENNPKKKLKKRELEEASDIKTNGDASERIMPQVPMRRTRRSTRFFSPDGLTVSTNDETSEPKKQERGDKRRNPPKQSACLASKVAEIADKKSQKKQRKGPTLNQQSIANVQEASNDNHLRRSARNSFEGANVAIVEQTIMGTAAENDKLKTMSLPVEETPVIDVELVSPKALESKAYPESNERNTSRSSEDFRGQSAAINPVYLAPVSAVNEVAADMTLDLEGQQSLSAKCQGVSVIEPTMESSVELLIKEKESSILEEVKENSWDENIEGGVDDSLRNSMDTGGDSSDYQLVQQVEDPKKHIDVDAIIPDSSLSPTYKVDSEGEPSNCLDIEETLETEDPVVGNSSGLRSNEVYVKSSNGDRDNDNSGQDFLNEVAEGRESETYSENLFEEAENTCPIFPQTINTEMVEKIHFCNANLGNSGAVPCVPATESQDGTVLLDETTFGREAEFSVQDCHDEMTEVISATKEHESESKEALNKGLQSAGAISINLSCNFDDALVGGEDNVNGSGYATALKNIYEEILAPQIEADVMRIRRVDFENIETANNQEKDHSADRSCKSPEAYSTTCLLLNVSSPHDQLGDEDRPQVFSEDKDEPTHKEAIAEDKENEGYSNDESNAGESNEDPSDAIDELNQKYDVSISEFSDELFDDHKGEAEKVASINDDNMTPDQSLCNNGTDSVVKQMVEALDVHAMDGKSIRSEDKDESTNKEAIADDKENEGSSNVKSNGGVSNEDPSDATNELNQKYDVSISEFSDELFDDHKGEAEKVASINDDNMTPGQSLCNNGTDSVVKQTEESLDVLAMDGKSIRSEGLQKHGALSDLSFNKEMIHDMIVDCFISSLEKNSEHRVQTTEVTTMVINTSLSSGEEGNVEYVHNLFEEAGLGSENDVGKKEIGENVMTSEDFDQVFKSQLGEHVHHTTEPAVSEDLIPGDCKDSNDQDDASAIIQEYMEHETGMDEITKLDSCGPLDKGNMTRVSVEFSKTDSVVEPGLGKVFKDCGEENEETLATSSRRMNLDEEDIGVVADAMELPEIKAAAPTECTDDVPVNHKISKTPDLIQETVRCDEVKFKDVESNVEVSTELDGSASMALDNSACKDGKATIIKGKVGSMFDDSNSQTFNFFGENRIKVDSVLDVLSDEINDKLAYEEVHGWDYDDPDTALLINHGKKAVSIDESCDDSLEGRTGSDDAEYGTGLLEEALISPPKVEESCIFDENNSTAIKLMIDSTICSPLTGKESECQAYKKCPKNCMEGMELDNMDGGIISREIYSPRKGNTDLGSYQEDSLHRQRSLKEGCLTGDIDFLELNNLFSSNSSKINFKQTGNDLDFQNFANVELEDAASKDAAELEEVQCPADYLVTAASNDLMRITTTESPAGRKIENNTVDSDADLPLFTGFELNLFSEYSQKEEVEKIFQRRIGENLMSDTNGDMKREENNSVSISTKSAEQGFNLEIEMVNDVDFASDDPSKEIEGSKQEGIVSERSLVFEGSIESGKHIKESSGAFAKCPSYDENTDDIAGDYKSSGFKDVTIFAVTSLQETGLNKYGLEVNATMMSPALDGPATECRGSRKKGGVLVKTIGAIEFENFSNFAASGEPTAACGADDSKQLESSYLEETGVQIISSLIKNNSSDDMLEAMDSSKGESVTNVESLDVASDEPIYGKVGPDEKCEAFIINHVSVDCCENDQDDFALLEKCQETTEIEGNSSDSSKHTTEFGGNDLRKHDPALLNVHVEGAVSEDAKASQGKFEFGQENSSETNLFQSISIFANPIRTNSINISVPATPKIVNKAHDMKENVLSAKREQFGSLAMSRKSAKRRPLEDLHKN